MGSVPGSGRSLGGGHSNLLQYFFPEEPHGHRRLVSYSPWGQRSLVGYGPQGSKESETTEAAWYAMSKISTVRGGQVEMKQTLDFWHQRNTEEHILFSQNSRGKEENKTQPLY